jgi:hypothetical protein
MSHRPLLLGALLFACLAPACLQANKVALEPTPEPVPQRDPTERLLELAQRDNRAMQHLRTLTQEFGPRLTGSERYDRAAQWCLEQFQSWGLQAHLETWGELPVRCDRGVQRGRETWPKQRDLEFLTRAWSRGTRGPLRARAMLEPADAAQLQAHRHEYAGAWILRRTERPPVAVRNAFEALLDSAPPAGVISSSGGELLHMSGNPSRKLVDVERQRQVEILLRGDQHQELCAELEGGKQLELEFEVENRLLPGPVPCTNVVAEIRGSEFPEQYVVVGGHLDSWDGAQGAQDGGTAVASTLEAARLIASLNQKPRRTLRFVLFSGQEQGMLGSLGYVKAHHDELARTSAVLIHEGGSSPLAGLDVSYAMYEDVQRVLAPLATLDRIRPVRVHERLGLRISEESDQASFLGEGLAPAFAWNQSGAGYEYVAGTQHDVFEHVAPADEEHNARVVALAAFGLAQLDGLLDRTDMEPLAPRRLGVAGFSGATLLQVAPEGRAHEAGWQEGDVIVRVDGKPVDNREEILRAINQGGPRKTIRLRRGSEELDTSIDWSDDPDEPERSARAGRREAWIRLHPRVSAAARLAAG